MKKQSFQNIDEYISPHTLQQQKILSICEAAPDAREMISHNIPPYKQNKTLVYFAVAKNHLGFYPTALGIQNFKKELSSYKTSKGAIQFSLHDSLPKDLIQKIVEFRLKCDSEDRKKKPTNGSFLQLPEIARCASEKIGITELEHLKKFNEQALLQLRGFGKTTLFRLQTAMTLMEVNFLNQ
ncbi:DUF1801 domain-containing protein [Arachidicoccus sp.]|uniref:DUF1801 domain-containing protein n=1 Tax=Arachidicoccus sp. TaxID=1872624 RepID=UPI003D252EC9